MKSDNEIIAEFMGLSVRMFGPVLYASDEDGMIDFKGDATPYWPDRNWNQLMPVVEKIATISPVQQVSVSTRKTRVWFSVSSAESYIEAAGDSMISRTYNTVVEFIKLYNEQ